jgi:hypothetical protein
VLVVDLVYHQKHWASVLMTITGGRETLGTLLVGGGNTAVGSEVPAPDTAGVGEGVGKPRVTLGLVVVFTGKSGNTRHSARLWSRGSWRGKVGRR